MIEAALRQIKENLSTFTSLEIDESSFSDDDALTLHAALSENDYIQEIKIKNPGLLTHKSYLTFIHLLQECKNINSFKCHLIMPIHGAGTNFWKAAERILAERKQKNVSGYLPSFVKVSSTSPTKAEECKEQEVPNTIKNQMK